MLNSIGAPKGGRVHWLLIHLPNEFKAAYRLRYDYSRHNYVFYRMRRRDLFDIFIVSQTSVHYWQLTYVNFLTQDYYHFGSQSAKNIAKKMFLIYREKGIINKRQT